MKQCKDCTHAQFQRSPTGRIRKQFCGYCGMQQKLLTYYRHDHSAPCIVLSVPHAVAIWFDYDASHCPLFNPKESA
jgi:hypothetical protein